MVSSIDGSEDNSTGLVGSGVGESRDEDGFAGFGCDLRDFGDAFASMDWASSGASSVNLGAWSGWDSLTGTDVELPQPIIARTGSYCGETALFPAM